MPPEDFYAFILIPSADIHLVLDSKFLHGGNELDLQINGFYKDSDQVIDITEHCRFTMADSNIAVVSPSGKLSPILSGQTFLRVTYTDPLDNQDHNLVARIWVHRILIETWIGNNALSVNEGHSNMIISVTAKFDQGDVCDITGHGYVEIQSMDTSKAIIDKTGRLTGVSKGTTKLKVKILVMKEDPPFGSDIGGYSSIIEDREIPLFVKPPINAPKEIVELVHYGSGFQKRNILFLSEGFKDTPEEKEKFKAIVRTITQRMTRADSNVHEPFGILKEDYNIWLAFDPSEEGGISYGFPISHTSNVPEIAYPSFGNTLPANSNNYSVYDLFSFFGFPNYDQSIGSDSDVLTASGFDGNKLEGGILRAWQATFSSNILQARNSNLGLIYGARLASRKSSSGPAPMDNSWYNPVKPFSFFNKDPRRTGPNYLYWYKEFFEYLGSLYLKRGNGLIYLDFIENNVGKKWALGGEDQGLVIVIVNDSMGGGNYHKILEGDIFGVMNVFGAVPLGTRHNRIAGIFESLPKLDHTPNTTQSGITFDVEEYVVATALHELAHAFFLGDEYEARSNSGNQFLPSNQVIWVELQDNLTAPLRIKNDPVSGGQFFELAYDKIKWNKLYRVSKGSGILKDSEYVGTTSNIGELMWEIEVFPGEGLKWFKGEKVFLRTRNLNIDYLDRDYHRYYPSYRNHKFFEFPFEILEVLGDKIKLVAKTWDIELYKDGNPTKDNVFPKGSLIYQRRQYNGKDLSLMLPGVYRFLSENKEVFAKHSNCNEANPKVVHPPQNIPNISQPQNREYLVGLYQGGHTYNCRVYRPTGNCRMRNTYDNMTDAHFDFCYVCQYSIVNEINPSKLNILDDRYPGEQI